MVKYLKFKSYSLSSKVILIFLISMILFNLIKVYLVIPILKEKNFEYKINEITQILNTNKKQIELSIISNRNQSILEADLSKLKVEVILKEIFADSGNYKNLKNNLDKTEIRNFCEYNIFGENINIKNEVYLNSDFTIFDKWQRFQDYQNVSEDTTFFYNKKVRNNILALACKKERFQKTSFVFSKDLREHIKNTLIPISDSYDIKTTLLWIDSPNLKKEDNLENIELIYNKRGHTLKQFLNINNYKIEDLNLSQILESKGKRPISHLFEDKEVLTWVVSLDVSKKANRYLVLFTIEKKQLEGEIDANTFNLLPEFVISLVVVFVLVYFVLKRTFRKMNKLTKTAIRIKKGQKKIRSEVNGDDDIGILGESFDSMVEFFENSINQLDLKVEEKTKEIVRSLDEKETLLKEIHHRVKNNLSLTICMIELQEKDINDEETKRALVEIKDRIYIMELLHRKLYESSDLNKITMGEYISELIEAISNTYDSNDEVDVFINIDDINLSLQEAMPYGLILNELISNSYKHAFKNIENPLLSIEFLKLENHLVLKVKDNGSGLKNGFSSSYKETLGLKLLNSIVEIQLFGEIKYTYNNGSEFIIEVEIA